MKLSLPTRSSFHSPFHTRQLSRITLFTMNRHTSGLKVSAKTPDICRRPALAQATLLTLRQGRTCAAPSRPPTRSSGHPGHISFRGPLGPRTCPPGKSHRPQPPATAPCLLGGSVSGQGHPATATRPRPRPATKNAIPLGSSTQRPCGNRTSAAVR